MLWQQFKTLKMNKTKGVRASEIVSSLYIKIFPGLFWNQLAGQKSPVRKKWLSLHFWGQTRMFW